MKKNALHIVLLSYSVIISILLFLQIKQDSEMQLEHHDLKLMLDDFHHNDSVEFENYILRNYVKIIDHFYLIGKSRKEIENLFSINSICYLQEISKEDEVFESIVKKQYPKVFPSSYNVIMQLEGFNCYFLFYNDTLYRRIDEGGHDYSINIEYYIKNKEILFDED